MSFKDWHTPPSTFDESKILIIVSKQHNLDGIFDRAGSQGPEKRGGLE